MRTTPRSILAAGALAFGLLFTAQSAYAEDLPRGGLTREDVAAWLRGQNLTATIHNDSRGQSIVSSTTGGVNFDVYFYDCEGARCRSVQFAAGWTPLALGTPEKINEWNRDKRYVRAYLDSTSNVWGEYDIDISPGGSWEQMNHGLERFNSQIVAFKAYFGG